MEKKSTYNHPSTILLLILLGMSVLVFQTSHSYMQSSIKVESKVLDDSGNSENQESQEVISGTQNVFLSVSTIHIDQELHQIKEIIFGDDNKEKHTHIITKYVSSFFKTLFEQVISPNAP
jgi:hypothetical protein